MKMQENWLPVPGYEKFYEINTSSHLVRSLDRTTVSKIKSIMSFKGRIISFVITIYGYKRVTLCLPGKKPKAEFVHRIIAKLLVPNPENKPQVNHINGIKTDNRKENLRLATRSQNMLNSHKVQATNTSGYPGVSYVSSRKKWRAYIKIGYKQISGGYFNTLEEAILARTKLELKYEHCAG